MNILVCIIGFIIGTITLSLVFKIALGELTVGCLFFSFIFSLLAFLGLQRDGISSVIIANTPTVTGIISILVVKIIESDWFNKKIF